MDTPNALRKQAQQWRSLAGHQSGGMADALIEAACDLEIRAHRLEAGVPAARLQTGADAAEPPPRRTWRFLPRRFGGAR